MFPYCGCGVLIFPDFKRFFSYFFGCILPSFVKLNFGVKIRLFFYCVSWYLPNDASISILCLVHCLAENQRVLCVVLQDQRHCMSAVSAIFGNPLFTATIYQITRCYHHVMSKELIHLVDSSI